jgi:hypothetical protein
MIEPLPNFTSLWMGWSSSEEDVTVVGHVVGCARVEVPSFHMLGVVRLAKKRLGAATTITYLVYRHITWKLI